MKQKILVLATVVDKVNGIRNVSTSLEVSNRKVNQNDLDKFYNRLNNKLSNVQIKNIKIYLTITKNNREIYKNSREVYAYDELIRTITDYGMIAAYEYAMKA